MRWLYYRGIRSPFWTKYPPLTLRNRTFFFSHTVVAQSRWTYFLPTSGACQVHMRYSLEVALPATQVAEVSDDLAAGPFTISGQRASE